jgi:drug/metabolite transporter (DMT)-like permease
MNYRAFIPENPTAKGILCFVLSVFLFSMLNVIVKHLSTGYSILQITFFRCLFALIPAMMMAAAMGGVQKLKTKRIGGHLGRAFAGTTSMIFFFYAFHLMPLAEAQAIGFSGPIFVALLSILILKEQVGPHRWGAIIAGFIGVMVMINPVGAMTGNHHVNMLGAGSALLSAFLYGFSMIGMRSLAQTESIVTSVLYFSIFSTIGTALALPFVWKAPAFEDFALFIASGLIAVLSQTFMTRAYQYASAAVVSPFTYTSMIWAALFGWMFWSEVPSPTIWYGAVIVIASGLYILWRETRHHIPITEDLRIKTPDQLE